MWLCTPTGLTVVFAVLGLALYWMERIQRGEEFDFLDAIKFSVLAGAVAFGSAWLTETPGAVATAAEMVEEVFTGTPNF
jgi:hypothetical protein